MFGVRRTSNATGRASIAGAMPTTDGEATRNGDAAAQATVASGNGHAGPADAAARDAGTDHTDTLQSLAEHAGELAIEVADVAGNVTDVHGRLRRQSHDLDGLREAAEAVRADNSAVAESVQRCTDEAERAERTLADSRTTMERSLAEIRALAEAVTSIQSRIDGLQSALDKVAGVASNIDAIARQTNLLALNATIEAQRAGEAGKGFTVVAEEVKTLSQQTSRATSEIHETLQQLKTQTDELIAEGQQSAQRADSVRDGTEDIGTVVETVGDALATVRERANEISRATETIGGRCDSFAATVGELDRGVAESTDTLGQCGERIGGLTDRVERLIGLTAVSGVVTVDTPFITAVQDKAREVAAAFEAAIARGEISEAALFDFRYTPIPNTNPEQVMAPFTEMTDRILPPLQEPMLEFDARVVFCAAVDINGYLPTHNKKFSKPQSDDPVWNTGNCRNRRIFDDRVGAAAGRHTEPFLLQAYRRNMGDSFVMMKDVSAPVYVHGRHWGGVRLAYKA